MVLGSFGKLELVMVLVGGEKVWPKTCYVCVLFIADEVNLIAIAIYS
jgi:hypothetical protein